METLKPTKMLEFNPNQLAKVREALGYSNIGKLKQDIDILENWISKQNHFVVKNFDREYLERYLICNKGSVERAKKHLDRLCASRNLMPEFFKDFDVKNEFKYMFKCAEISVLPTPTPDNYRIVITRIFDDCEEITLFTYYRYVVALIEYFLGHDYCQGFVLVLDLRELPFSVVSKMNPFIIHKATTLIVETLAQRIKGIHFLSGSKFFDAAFSIIKMAVSAKLRERLFVHNDFESLYDVVPKNVLPKDYGGSGKSMKELRDINFEELSSDEHIAQMKFMETAVTNEKNRISNEFGEDCGLPGSFRTLCVD